MSQSWVDVSATCQSWVDVSAACVSLELMCQHRVSVLSWCVGNVCQSWADVSTTCVSLESMCQQCVSVVSWCVSNVSVLRWSVSNVSVLSWHVSSVLHCAGSSFESVSVVSAAHQRSQRYCREHCVLEPGLMQPYELGLLLQHPSPVKPIIHWCAIIFTVMFKHSHAVTFHVSRYSITYSYIWHFCHAMLCISVAIASMRCLSVCLSHSWVAPKRIKISSKFFHHHAATPFKFFHTKWGGDIPTGTPLMGASNARGVWKIDDFRPISRCISETVIVRWAHAARQFVSIEFSFHPYNI